MANLTKKTNRLNQSPQVPRSRGTNELDKQPEVRIPKRQATDSQRRRGALARDKVARRRSMPGAEAYADVRFRLQSAAPDSRDRTAKTQGHNPTLAE